MKVRNRKRVQVTTKLEELTVISVNARSLTVAKREHLLRVAETSKAHVLCVQETWWTPNSRCSNGFGDKWRVFRKDRSGHGGGVMIAVRCGVSVLRAREDPALEMVGVEIQLGKGKSMWIDSLYVPPGEGGPDVETGLGAPTDRRYIFGDMNFASRGDWTDARIQDGWTLASPEDATHNRGGILDGVLLSSQAADIGLRSVVLDDWLSDHACLEHRIGVNAEVEYQRSPKSWVYSRADWEGYRSSISNEVSGMAPDASATEVYRKLVKAIGTAASKWIPRAPRRNKPSVWNDELEELRKTAANFRKEVREVRMTGGIPDEATVAAAEASTVALRAAVRTAQRDNFAAFQVKQGSNLNEGKVFWRFIRQLRSEGPKREVRDAVRAPDGSLVSGPLADRLIREHILREARKVRTQLRAIPLKRNQMGAQIVDTELTEPFTAAEVEAILSGMKTAVSPGPDDISVMMLKQLPRGEGMDILQRLANLIWANGVIPGRMKEARLVRLDKPNCQDPYALNNIRFISVESTIARVVEALVATRLSKVIERHQLLPDEAHGFRAGRSTISALRSLRQQTETHAKSCECCRSDPRGRLSAVLQLDFSKFYDRITAKLLCNKMESLGIGGRVIEFVRDWMVGRIAWISCSVAVRVKVGLPQGSPISCSLANIFITDLIRELKDKNHGVTNYADDNNIIGRASNKADPIHVQAAELSDRLTEALIISEDWADRSGARLNKDKCKISCFLPRNNRFEGKVLQFMKIPGIEKELEPTLLGVTMDRFALGGKHIRGRIQKASKRAGALKILSHVGLRVVRQLYVGGVRACALYGIEAFQRITDTGFGQLERFQSCFLRYVARLRDGVPSAIVGRLFRTPPVRLLIECRWKIRDGMDRGAARQWLDQEWDRVTPPEHRVPVTSRDDPVWSLPRSLQAVILRARSGYTLLQPPENPFAPCDHPRCMDNGWFMSAEHILVECHKFSSKRTRLRVVGMDLQEAP